MLVHHPQVLQERHAGQSGPQLLLLGRGQPQEQMAEEDPAPKGEEQDSAPLAEMYQKMSPVVLLGNESAHIVLGRLHDPYVVPHSWPPIRPA
jgi:hypothetical protein